MPFDKVGSCAAIDGLAETRHGQKRSSQNLDNRMVRQTDEKTEPFDAQGARKAILALLARRARHATVCPSEVARALAGAKWRAAMPTVHDAIDQLVRERRVRLSWKGVALAVRSGPYRIGPVG